ncbi:MAG: hypothetical protein Kow0019_15720 [Methanobacteriaceae archaeon]
MKVLFVSSLSSKYNSGNSSYMHRLTFLKKGLENLGVETDIVYLGDFFLGKPAILSPFVAIKLKKILTKYDFVHAGGAGSAYAISVIKRLFKLKINLIYDVHGDTVGENYLLKRGFFDIITYFKIFQAKIMENIAFRESDYFITCSKPLKEFYQSKGISLDKIDVITNSVDTELFKPKKIKKYNKKFIVTYAGGFQKWQGIHLLLESAENLCDEDIIFRIIGFRNDDNKLKKEIKERLGYKCELIDALTREKLVEYLNTSDTLIIPRKYNKALNMAFPTKFAEYVSMGKPVILTDVSQISELVKKYKCGIVCKPNSSSLTEAIKGMKELDPVQINAMGMNGRKLAIEKLDKDVITNKFHQKLVYWEENYD